MQVLLGILTVTLGAFIAGTSPWPYKICKAYKLEQVMFICQFFGMFIVPWVIFFCLCNVPLVYNEIGLISLIYANIYSLVFGIGNILAINCLYKVGFISFSVLEGGTIIAVSTFLPFIFKGSGPFASAPDIDSAPGILSIISVIFMIISIVLMAYAGDMKDKYLGNKIANTEYTNKSLWNFICIVAGVMCSGLLLLNTYYGALLKDAATAGGCLPNLSSLSLWTFGMFGCIFINVLYSLCLMIKNKTYNIFSNMREFTFSVVGGVQYILYLFLIGFGTPMIGSLGASVGNGISMSGSALGKQIIGFLCGEWRGVHGKPVKILVLSIIFLLLGIVILSFGTYLNR